MKVCNTDLAQTVCAGTKVTRTASIVRQVQEVVFALQMYMATARKVTRQSRCNSRKKRLIQPCTN